MRNRKKRRDSGEHELDFFGAVSKLRTSEIKSTLLTMTAADESRADQSSELHAVLFSIESADATALDVQGAVPTEADLAHELPLNTADTAHGARKLLTPTCLKAAETDEFDF